MVLGTRAVCGGCRGEVVALAGRGCLGASRLEQLDAAVTDEQRSVDVGAVLARELAHRVERDQELRADDAPVTDDRLATWGAVDRDNTAWLKVIVERHGWPGRRLVGDEGSEHAWLLAQHADHDPVFQRRCLDMLGDAVARGDASPITLAYLTDRVRLASGQCQLYGT